MGWTGLNRQKGTTNLKFFQREFGDRVIDAAQPRGENAVYLACREGAEVYAVVVLVQWVRGDYFNFRYKEMGENSEPFYYNCPRRIFDQLTPTQNECALKWRAKVMEHMAEVESCMGKLKVGALYQLPQGITLCGYPLHLMEITSVRPLRAKPYPYGQNFKLSKNLLLQSTLVEK